MTHRYLVLIDSLAGLMKRYIDNIMKKIKILFICFIAFILLCSNKEKAEAVQMLEQIIPGMTYSEVSKLLPEGKVLEELPILEHGGTWYEVNINEKYVLQVRFEKYDNEKEKDRCIINYSPILKDIQSGKLVVGRDESW